MGNEGRFVHIIIPTQGLKIGLAVGNALEVVHDEERQRGVRNDSKATVQDARKLVLFVTSCDPPLANRGAKTCETLVGTGHGGG